MPERGYVVVRPDGTVMWETASSLLHNACFIAADITGILPSQLEEQGYRLARLRVEDNDGRD